jgi:hypothetical protein
MVTEESSKETVKTTAQGKLGVPVEPVVTTLVCSFYFACEAAGAAGTRLSLRPLISRGCSAQQLGRDRAAGMRMCVRRHCEEQRDEAIHSFFARQDGLLRGACRRARIRATRRLAMTTST